MEVADGIKLENQPGGPSVVTGVFIHSREGPKRVTKRKAEAAHELRTWGKGP